MKAGKGTLALAGLFGAAAGAGLLYAWQRRSPTAGGFPTTGGGASPVSLTGGVEQTTLTPGTQTHILDTQTAVILYLPQGGKWVSDNGAPIGDKTSPQAFVFLGPTSHDYVWIDPQGQQQQSTLMFSVTPTVPTLNT